MLNQETKNIIKTAKEEGAPYRVIKVNGTVFVVADLGPSRAVWCQAVGRAKTTVSPYDELVALLGDLAAEPALFFDFMANASGVRLTKCN